MRRALAAACLFLAAAVPCRAADEKPEEPAPVIAAEVNGVLITEHEVTAPYQEKVVQPEDRAKLRLHMLTTKIVLEVLYQEARRKGVLLPQDLVQQEVDRRVRESGGLLSFVRNLRQQRLTYAQYVEDLRRELTIQLYQQRFLQGHSRRAFSEQVADLAVRPSEIREYYEDHPDEFQREKEGRVRVIAFYNRDYDSIAAAQQQAEKVLAMARAGADFEKLARTYSGVRREEGGLFRLSGEAGLNEELARRLRGLSEGETTPVFREKDAFYILRLEENKSSEALPFPKVADAIRRRIRERRFRKQQRLLLQRLLRKASIRPPGLLEELLASGS